MAGSKQMWLSRAGRRVMLARLRCRLGRHNWQRIHNPESGRQLRPMPLLPSAQACRDHRQQH
jgi:hypothetical protein